MRLAQMEAIAARLDRERATRDRPSKWEDLCELSETLNRRAWKPLLGGLERGGPTMVGGGLAGIENPNLTVTVNQATVTGSATEQALIPTALLPIRQNVASGTVFELMCSGTSTTAATPGTYTLASRIGPAPTNASPLFGAVSGNFTPIASATAAQWQLTGYIAIRGSGTANTAVASLVWNHSATIGGGGPSSTAAVFTGGIIGGISASFDSTGSTCALWIGVTHATSTTNTWVPQSVVWPSWN